MPNTPITDVYVALARCAAVLDLTETPIELDSAVEAAVTAARKAWLASDEPCEWEFVDGGSGHSERQTHGNSDAALAALRAWIAAGIEPGEETVYTRGYLWLIDPATDERCDDCAGADEITVVIDPKEPECDGDHDHDWRSPYQVVGGIRENPGVQGNGGGVIVREVCSWCGIYRIVNTWATDPTTGQQGVESTSYEDADDDSLAWVAELRGA